MMTWLDLACPAVPAACRWQTWSRPPTRWCSWRAGRRLRRMSGTRRRPGCGCPRRGRSRTGMCCWSWWASKVRAAWAGVGMSWDGGGRMRLCTAAPPPLLVRRPSPLAAAGVVQFQAALDAHRQWPTDDLALLLAGSMLHAPGAAPRSDVGVAVLDGQRDGPAAASGTDDAAAAAPYSGSHLRDHVELGLGCLRGAVAQGLLTRDAIKQVGSAGQGQARGQLLPPVPWCPEAFPCSVVLLRRRLYRAVMSRRCWRQQRMSTPSGWSRHWAGLPPTRRRWSTSWWEPPARPCRSAPPSTAACSSTVRRAAAWLPLGCGLEGSPLCLGSWEAMNAASLLELGSLESSLF